MFWSRASLASRFWGKTRRANALIYKYKTVAEQCISLKTRRKTEFKRNFLWLYRHIYAVFSYSVIRKIRISFHFSIKLQLCKTFCDLLSKYVKEAKNATEGKKSLTFFCGLYIIMAIEYGGVGRGVRRVRASHLATFFQNYDRRND